MTGPFSNALMTIMMENHDKLKKASDEPTDAFDRAMNVRDRVAKSIVFFATFLEIFLA